MFLFFKAHSKIFLGRRQWRNHGVSAKEIQLSLAKSFRRFNPKMQAFKHLGLDLKPRGTEEARQFNSFNDFWILAIYCSYSYGFKNVRNVIEMALKLLFLPQNHKNRPAAGGSAPQAPSVIRLSCIGLSRGLN